MESSLKLPMPTPCNQYIQNRIVIAFSPPNHPCSHQSRSLFRKRERLPKHIQRDGLVQQGGLGAAGLALALECPEGLDAETGEVSDAAGVIGSEMGDAVAVVGHCELTVEVDPFLGVGIRLDMMA